MIESFLASAFEDGGSVLPLLQNTNADIRRVVDRATSGYDVNPDPAAPPATAGRIDHKAAAEAVARAAATTPKPAVSTLISTAPKPPSSTSSRPGRQHLTTMEIYQRRAAATGQLAAPATFRRHDGSFDIIAIFGHRAAQVAAVQGRMDVSAVSEAIENFRAEASVLDHLRPLDAASIYATRANRARR